MHNLRPFDPTDRSPFSPVRLALGFSALTIAFLGALHLASPEFDPSWRMVSEYSLGGYPWLLSLFFLSWAVSTWALAVAIQPYIRTRAGTAGLAFLVLAGLGEAMAAVFDINQDVGHGVAGLLGVLGLPIAAVLITASLPADVSPAHARDLLIGFAALTWLAVAALVATLVLMTIQVAQAYGGQLPSMAPATLPAGVLRLAGWADRLIVVANCVWVGAVASRVTAVSKSETDRGMTVRATTASRPVRSAERAEEVRRSL